MSRFGAFELIVGSALVGVVSGCGSASEPLAAGTLATVQPVRGGGEMDRIAVDESVVLEGLARVLLDSGPQLLVRNAALQMKDATTVDLERGNAFVEVHPGDAFTVSVGELQLSTTDAGFSIEDGHVYVIRGEVAFTLSESRGTISAGERLHDGRVEPERLWEDWTGGLARPGPGLGSSSAIGALHARVPGALGQARWPLVVRRMDVRVRIVDDMAITEVEQLFFNPASEAVEGLYTISVPDISVLQRFSVDRNGQLVDGYIREKAQAAAAYQAQVYQGSTLDPALLEWVAPGKYKARIYPIQPGATRRIVVRYAEWLGRSDAGTRLYRFPMNAGASAPTIQEVSFEADLSAANAANVSSGFDAEAEGDTVRMRRSDFRPTSDLYLEIEDKEERDGLVAWRAEHTPPPRDPRAGSMPDESELDYVYVPLVLPDSVFGESEQSGLDMVIVADVSAGTDRSHLELGRTVVESLTAHLGEGDRIAIVASDVGLRTLGGDAALGEASSARIEGLLDALAREPSGGATDLGSALADAAALLDAERHGVVVYVGDAAPTVGELGAEALLERVARLPQPLRAYGVGVGPNAQLELLDAITRGGGLALRVETRAGAAQAALQILGHAEQPAAHRVTIEMEGVEQLFPRTAADVVRGGVLAVVGRVEEDLPNEIVVRGMAGGSEFEERLTITEKSIDDEGDMRLRWASERLRQLLLSGGTREEIADLGVRYGIITPFTSFYVPSAAELASLGEAARPLLRQPPGFEASSRFALVPATALLTMGACTDAEPATASGAESNMAQDESDILAELEITEEVPAEEPAPSADPADPNMPMAQTTPSPDNAAYGAAAAQPARPESSRRRPAAGAPPVVTATETSTAEPVEPVVEAEPEISAGSERGPMAEQERAREAMENAVLGMLRGDEGGAELRRTMGEDGSAADDAARDRGEGDLEDMIARTGALGLRGSGSGGGGLFDSESGDQRNSDADRELRTQLDALGYAQAHAFNSEETGRGNRYGNRNGNRTRVDVQAGAHRITVTVDPHQAARHTRRRCSDAATLLLDSRREVWRERLNNGSGIADWLNVYRQARRNCELRRWRDHRALLNLVLAKAGNISRMIAVYRMLGGSSARAHVRRSILRRVRTPEDLRLARQAFGASAADNELIAQVLERAGDGPAKIRALRRLISQFKTHLDLKLQLLEELERAGRIAEARRLAHALRSDPMTDAGVRTAIGEMYLRMDDEPEARRVFSEIVEFAPQDALARRRLGDLHIAHGWYEDAYRQYETLARITPDDPSVALLLARAAAGAGRVDEALRLEQGLAESTGGDAGLGRVALLWSSVRFAELRQEAREASNSERLDALAARMRRSGVLRISSAVRATLVWSHPDAALSLWAGHPGLGVTRPADLAPEYGIEAFDVQEQEPGAYELEVRHVDAGHLTEVSAKLVVVWNEGQQDEKIVVHALTFTPQHHRNAFRLQGRELTEVTQ